MAVVEGLQSLDFGNELSPLFVRPKSIDIQRGSDRGTDVFEEAVNWRLSIVDSANQLRADYDHTVEREFDWSSRGKRAPATVDYVRHLYGDRDSPVLEAKALISYILGICFGRWSFDVAMSDFMPPSDAETVFENLPDTPYASGERGNHRPMNMAGDPQPSVTSDGFEAHPIFVCDEGNKADVVRAIELCCEQALNNGGMDLLNAATKRISEAYSVSNIRSWFRSGFFADHIDRYSRGKLKAPIYWQFGTPSASYSTWVYYHRLNRDTLFRLLNEHVVPKLQFEDRKLTELSQEASPDPSSRQRKEIAAQEIFVDELRSFCHEVTRVAPLWNPNLNDGAILNFAPLWRLVPQHKTWQKECKKVWDKLCKGEFDWAHIAMHLWPERVVPKCSKDRSLAIAHGLVDTFWQEDAEGKLHSRRVDSATVEKLIAERTVPAVKSALDDLISAPVPTGGWRRPTRS